MNSSRKRLELRFIAWDYPIFAVKALVKALFLRLAGEISLSPRASDEEWASRQERVPPALQQFERGELLKWKGVEFRVFKVVGDPTPGIIIVPTAITHGKKVKTYRQVRQAQKDLSRVAS